MAYAVNFQICVRFEQATGISRFHLLRPGRHKLRPMAGGLCIDIKDRDASPFFDSNTQEPHAALIDDVVQSDLSVIRRIKSLQWCHGFFGHRFLPLFGVCVSPK